MRLHACLLIPFYGQVAGDGCSEMCQCDADPCDFAASPSVHLALYLAHSLGELLPISSFVMKPSLSRPGLICQNCHTMALSEGAVGSRQRSS